VVSANRQFAAAALMCVAGRFLLSLFDDRYSSPISQPLCYLVFITSHFIYATRTLCLSVPHLLAKALGFVEGINQVRLFFRAYSALSRIPFFGGFLAFTISQIDGLIEIMIRRFPDKLPIPAEGVHYLTAGFLAMIWMGYAVMNRTTRRIIKLLVALILGVRSAQWRVNEFFHVAAQRTARAATVKLQTLQVQRNGVGPRTSPRRG
jgi:hypothetical protein